MSYIYNPVWISGSLAYDRIMDFPGKFKDHILPDKIHILNLSFLIKDLKENFGGTAGNTVYNLKLLGIRPIIFSQAGRDFLPYQKWLSKNKIPQDHIKIVKNELTATAYIITDESDNQITAFYPGAMKIKSKIKNQKSKLKLMVQSVKLAIVAPGNLDDMRELVDFYQENKIPYIYDPGQSIPALTKTDLLRGLSKTRVLIGNDYEIELILAKTDLTKRLLLNRIDLLVTTLGRSGSMIENGWQKVKIPAAHPLSELDPTGAGDAYRAGLIKGLLMRLPLEKIGRLAAVCAVYTVERYGTQTHRFRWEQIVERYKENFGEL